MNKIKRFLIGLLCAVSVSALAFGFSACEDEKPSGEVPSIGGGFGGLGGGSSDDGDDNDDNNQGGGDTDDNNENNQGGGSLDDENGNVNTDDENDNPEDGVGEDTHVHTFLKLLNLDCIKSEATCLSPTVYYKSCACGAMGDETFTYGDIDPNAHTFDQEVAEEEYLQSTATCLTEAIYYKSCACGERNDETFNHGDIDPTAHTFDQEVAEEEYLKSAATCLSAAVYYKSCACGEHNDDTFNHGNIDPNAHTFDQEVAEEEYLQSTATCLSAAMYYKSCACGEHNDETFTYGNIDPNAHTFDQEVVEEEYLQSVANCLNAAIYYRSCSCGEKGETAFSYGDVDADNHLSINSIASEEYLKTSATCLSAAEYYKSCTCGEIFEETFKYGAIDLNAHTFDQEVATDAYFKELAACTSGAVYYKSCACGEKGEITFVYGDPDLTAHTFDQEIVAEEYLKTSASCLYSAEYHKSCVCGTKGEETFSYGEPNPSVHIFDQEIADNQYLQSAANCIESAVYYRVCACGEVGEETFSYGEPNPNVHIFNQERAEEEYLKSAVTCVDAAVYYKSCVCGKKSTTTFTYGESNPNAHVLTTYCGQAATCTQDGWAEYQTCSKCDYSTYQTLLALGHDYDVENVEWVWNGYESATATFVCQNDNAHNQTLTATRSSQITLAPTCTETGTKLYTARVMFENAVYTDEKTETLAANGHEYTYGVTLPTCVKDGEMWTWCFNCDYTQRQILPAIGSHTYGDWYIVIAATCEEDGLLRRDCTFVVDGATNYGEECPYYETEVIPATGHDESSNICSVCEKKLWSAGLTYALSEDETSYTVTGMGTCQDTDLIIPSTYQNLPVTAIEDYAFQGCNNIENITIPYSVQTIGDYAFAAEGYWTGTSNLKNVTIGKSVTSIGEYAFAGCTNLLSVTIGDSVTTIGYGAFNDCYHLTEIYNRSSLDIKVRDYYAMYVATEESERGTFATDENGYIIYTNGNDKVLVGYRGGETELTLPDDITWIKSYAFYNSSSLTGVVIGDFVTAIGDYAFNNCNNLVSVTIGASVTSIGDKAFYNCYHLTEVYNKSSLEITLGENEYDPFEENSYVGYYAVRVVVEESERGTFMTDDNGYIIYTNGNDKVLVGYTGEGTELLLPDGITEIKPYAFYNCDNLTSVTIPSSLTVIGTESFGWGGNLQTVYYTGDIVSWCQIIGLDSLPSFDSTTLYINKELITGDLIIPDGVETINDYAFAGCSGLTSVTIPSSVKQIGDRAFSDWQTSLQAIYYTGDIAGWCAIEIGEYSFGPAKLYIDGVLIEGDLIIPDGVETINDYAFYNCDNLTSVTLPASLTVIGTEAFCWGSNLQTVYYKGDIYGWCAIKRFSSLVYDAELYIGDELIDDLALPEGVETINDYAFAGCSSLTSVTIGNLVATIGDGAFSNCKNLTNVTIDDSVTTIGDSAFAGCRSLTNVVIGNSVTRIGADAFNSWNGKLQTVYYTGDIASWCVIEKGGALFGSEIQLYIDGELIVGEVMIPEGVEYVGNYTFYNCDNLTSVTIPDSVTTIGYSAFSNCDSLTSITIGNSVTTIGDGAFYGCSGLTSITIGNSVTTIGNSAFYGCSGLTSITIPDSVTTIGDGAFYECYRLTEVYNKSSLVITAGDIGCSGEGYYATYVGYYATHVVTEESERGTFATDNNGYIIYTNGNDKVLVGYMGEETELTLPNGITWIKPYAFYDYDSLTSVTIGDSVTTIGHYAFAGEASWKGASNLENVTIGNSVTTIGEGAFSNCPIQTATIPAIACDSINNSALQTVVITSGDTIGDKAFYNCDNLMSVTIPDSITTIGNMAFYGCTNLTSITIPDSVTAIGNMAFYGCERLTEVYNKSSLNITAGSYENGYVGYYATHVVTEECQRGTFTTDENGYTIYTNGDDKVLVTYTGTETNLILPNGITWIRENIVTYTYPYYDLTSIVIPDSVTTIEDGAFGWGLQAVYYKGSVDEWQEVSGSDTFDWYSTTIYYYIENEEDLPTDGGNYWHYVDGVVTVW